MTYPVAWISEGFAAGRASVRFEAVVDGVDVNHKLVGVREVFLAEFTPPEATF